MMEKIHLEDSERKQHRLCHCGKIIFFQCKTSSEYNVKAAEILFSSLSFDQGGNSFVRANDGAAVINKTRSCDIVTCKCVFDVQKRVTTPCILLVYRRKSESFKYSLLTLSSSNRLEPHMEFQLPYQMQDDVGILPGPIVIWSHAASVFYTSLQAPEVRQIPAQLSQIIIGVLPLHKEQVFFLGLQNSSAEYMTDARSSQALGYLPDNGQMFDGSWILPQPYCSITKSMLVLSAEERNGVLKTRVVAATCKKQLVYFESGIPKEVCQLPFEEPEDIQMVNTGRNGSLFVIYFDQGHVCAVWKETFQVASCWSGVSSIHVDDFLGHGTDQMLLVFAKQVGPGHPLENYLITDLCGTTYSHSQDSGDVLKTSHPAQENYLLTLQALESRLQSGLNLLQDLQRDVRVKERVIHQSVQSLIDVVSGRRPVLSQYEEEGLTSLWDGNDEPEIEAFDNKKRDVPAVSSKPQVDKLWHRIIEDQLVVGVILTTDSSRPVGSVSLSVSTETGQRSVPAVIQTHSQVFRLPTLGPLSPTSPSTRLEPAAKKSRRDNANTPSDSNVCRLAVTAVTDLTPLLNSGCVKCLVVLHYLHTQESSALAHDLTLFVLHCGHVPLDAQSNTQTRLLNDSKLTTDEVREDLLSLLAVLNRWVLHIDSPDHSLRDVDGWIQRTMGCERLEVEPQYLLSNPAGPAALMLFHWQQTTPFQGELIVHCSHLRMLQFLDSFLGFLPASCSIKSLKDLGTCRTTQVLSLTLEEEVLSLKDGVSSLLCCKDEEKERTIGKRHQETPEPHSVEGLQRCREDWDMDLKRSKTRLSPLVDIGSYRRLTQKLFKVKLEGDMAVLLESQRT